MAQNWLGYVYGFHAQTGVLVRTKRKLAGSFSVQKLTETVRQVRTSGAVRKKGRGSARRNPQCDKLMKFCYNYDENIVFTLAGGASTEIQDEPLHQR